MPWLRQGICIGDPYNHFVTIGLLVGAITTLVSGVLAVLVLNRFRQRGGMHLFMCGIGMLLYFGAGVCETVLAFGWSDLAFRLWYWSGAMLVPPCLLYTSDAADERSSVDLGGRRIIKKKNIEVEVRYRWNI